LFQISSIEGELFETKYSFQKARSKLPQTIGFITDILGLVFLLSKE